MAYNQQVIGSSPVAPTRRRGESKAGPRTRHESDAAAAAAGRTRRPEGTPARRGRLRSTAQTFYSALAYPPLDYSRRYVVTQLGGPRPRASPHSSHTPPHAVYRPSPCLCGANAAPLPIRCMYLPQRDTRAACATSPVHRAWSAAYGHADRTPHPDLHHVGRGTPRGTRIGCRQVPGGAVTACPPTNPL